MPDQHDERRAPLPPNRADDSPGRAEDDLLIWIWALAGFRIEEIAEHLRIDAAEVLARVERMGTREPNGRRGTDV